MSESNLTTEEQEALQRQLFEKELDKPTEERIKKINAQKDLANRLENPALAGGINSPLDPIHPHKLEQFGEPTISLKKENIKQPSKN